MGKFNLTYKTTVCYGEYTTLTPRINQGYNNSLFFFFGSVTKRSRTTIFSKNILRIFFFILLTYQLNKIPYYLLPKILQLFLRLYIYSFITFLKADMSKIPFNESRDEEQEVKMR